MSKRTSKFAMEQFISKLYQNHNPETIIQIIDQGYCQGKPNSAIRVDLETFLSIKIPPRYLKPLFEQWYPETFDMSKSERKKWIITHWSIMILEEKRWLKLYDASHPLYKHFTKINHINYHGQRAAAIKRGLKFEFDFISWIVWWISTGHFNERGVYNHSYQMCRFNDSGNYEWDNVYCATGKQNKEDYFQKNQLKDK